MQAFTEFWETMTCKIEGGQWNGQGQRMSHLCCLHFLFSWIKALRCQLSSSVPSVSIACFDVFDVGESFGSMLAPDDSSSYLSLWGLTWALAAAAREDILQVVGFFPAFWGSQAVWQMPLCLGNAWEWQWSDCEELSIQLCPPSVGQ